jgi:4-amino-4-deoxy-L-arabinose transferase-like glycosyltransferase
MNTYKTHLWLIFAFVFLFLLRFFRLSELGLHDYDAVTNFLAAKKIVEGDFSMLFHHAAPFLHSFDAFFYFVFQNSLNSFTFLIYGEASLQILAILFLCSILKKEWKFSATAAFFLALFVGSSPLLVYTGRCLTIDNGSLLFIILTLYSIQKNIFDKNENSTTQNYKNIIYLSIFFAIAFGFNYKSILILPFVFGYLFYQNSILDFIKKIAVFGGINIIFIGFWTLIGQLLIGKWTAYLGNLYYLIFEAHQREVTGESWIEFDLLYYFKYIFYFENPLIWIGMGMVIFSVIKNFLKRNETKTNQNTQAVSFEWKELINQKIIFWLLFLCSIAVPTLFLEKAPRIWILVLMLAYSLSAWVFLFGELLNKSGKWLLFLGIFYNCWLVMAHIYSYSATSYDEVINYLQEDNQANTIHKIYLKGTLQLVPFLENTTIKYEILPQNFDSLFNSENNNKLNITDSVLYILTDDYCVLADDCLEAETIMKDKKIKYSIRNKYAEKYKLLKEWKEPTLSEPFLYVEHSQYLGLNFSESYDLWQKQMQDSTTIRLYRVF